jgi:hypothetical protein
MARDTKLRKIKSTLEHVVKAQVARALNEDLGGDGFENEKPPLDKKSFLEACKQFSAHGASIYRAKDLKERVIQIKELIEQAEQLTLTETEEWFDKVTTSRHMKNLKESYKIFEKTATEVTTLQQRLEAAYEDIGQSLSKYYDVE